MHSFHALEEEIPQTAAAELVREHLLSCNRKGYSTDSTYELERFPFLQASHCREAGSIQQLLDFRFENSLDAAGRDFYL